MDRTVKLLSDKVTQLTNKFNSITQNSKKIHELDDAVSANDVYIAVSDGTNTGKVIYEPSEVTKEDFEKIKNLQLSNVQNTSTIEIKDSDGNVLTSLDLSFLNGNNVTLNVDNATQTLQLLNYNGDLVSFVSLSDLVIQKTKALFEHVLTAGDIANPIIDLPLPNTPDLTEWDFLYINSGAVSPASYTVVGNHLLIDTALLAYPIQAGRRITFRYMY